MVLLNRMGRHSASEALPEQLAKKAPEPAFLFRASHNHIRHIIQDASIPV